MFDELLTLVLPSCYRCLSDGTVTEHLGMTVATEMSLS